MSDDQKTTSIVGVCPRPGERPLLPGLVGLTEGVPALHWLRGRETLMGRDPRCELCIDVRGVSREHAKLVMSTPNQITLIDLRARNGTFVNGRRITDVVVLNEGDELHLGPLANLRFGRRVEDEAKDAADGPTATSMLALERLTAREREIASEVARGLTNAAIATKLSLKPRTVASHLEHIFAKLDIGSRTDLVRIVVEARRPR